MAELISFTEINPLDGRDPLVLMISAEMRISNEMAEVMRGIDLFKLTGDIPRYFDLAEAEEIIAHCRRLIAAESIPPAGGAA